MQWLLETFRQNPTIPIFLTIGLGYWLGKFKYKAFSLGSVTSILLVGVIVGQMNIPIEEPLKSLFFLLFLFAIGYQCGPQFVTAIRGQGIKQVLFAVIVCFLCFISSCVCAWIMDYNAGVATGLYAGSQTLSPMIGVASDTIKTLSVPAEVKKSWLDIIPVCYTVTYVYGAMGAVWILGTLGPKMLGGLEKVRAQTKELEEKLSHSSLSSDPAYVNGNQPVVFRAYKVTADHFSVPQTVAQIQLHFKKDGRRIFVERVRDIQGKILIPESDYLIKLGDEIVLSGRHEYIVQDESWIGPEIDDPALLTFAVEKTRIMITKNVSGLTIDQLRAKPFMYGVMIESLTTHEGVEIPVLAQTELHAGDMITIEGLPQEVSKAAPEIGYEERPTVQTDLIFLCIAIALGAFVGTWTISFGSIPVSLSTSGGALISGIIFGWLRTKRPSIGFIPASSLWFMNNLGLNLFIAVIGIQAGPTFISGLKAVGPMLFVMGVIATTIPLFLAIIIGDKIFKFHPAINLGCCAGGRKTTPGIGAVTSALGSSVPALGYTITYAVSNTISILLGVAMVFMFL